MFPSRSSAIGSKGLPDYGVSYFNNVLAEYRSIARQDGDAALLGARESADEIIARFPNVAWADLFALEILVMRLQPLERLRRRICILRLKYRQLVGDEAYRKYLECCPVDAQGGTPEELRSDMEQLLAEFHWRYSAAKTREMLFDNLQQNLIAPILLYWLFVILIGFLRVYQGESLPTLLIVILAGVTGAFTSIIRRLQLAQSMPASSTEDQITRFSELGFGKLGTILGLATGAVFSVVLYLIFIAGLLQGVLFPEIYSPSDPEGLSFYLFATRTDPTSGVEFAKLLVWSFLAGFAEQFLPDVLDRFVKRGAQAAAAGAQPAPNPGTISNTASGTRNAAGSGRP